MDGYARRSVFRVAAAILLTTGMAASLAAGSLVAEANTRPYTSVFATGFNNPRGLRFGPDGNLYVAEGGKGGTHSSQGHCRQVRAPVGPYTRAYTGRISVVSPTGSGGRL